MTSKIVVLPLGSWEQHGAHLPPETDSIIINEVVKHSIANSSEFIVAPTIAISASDEHAGFDNTLSTGTQPLVDSVVAICRSAVWATGICIVNGHGGNADALKAIASALHFENIRHSIWSLPSYAGADMHAGKTETSLMLTIAPELVDMSLAEIGALGDTQILIQSMRKSGVKSVAENGVLGNPTLASAEHGAEVLKLYVQSLQTFLNNCSAQWTP